MNADELLDDESLNSNKLFDENEYSTLIIGRDGFNKNQNHSADLIESLFLQNISRSECEEIYGKLKKLNARKLLVDTLTSAKKTSEKAILCAACWECGLDFTNHFLFFTKLACEDDFKLAMEALTVVENIEGNISMDELTQGISIVQNSKSKNTSILDFLVKNIKQRIS